MENQPADRSRNLIYLGSCLIAAVRLAREEQIKPSPRVMSRIGDSVQLAKMVWGYLSSR